MESSSPGVIELRDTTIYGSGTATPAETGLKISSKGLLTFATGQAFPGTGSGTVKSVATGTGLTGGPITTTGTLSVDATKVPLLAKSNTFTAEQIINSGGTTPSLSINNTSGAAGIVSTAVGAGVGGFTTSSTAYGGVEGWDRSSSGTGGGVYGYSPSGYGVKGASPGGYGVVGSATTGAAVFGSATSGSGVLGTATSGYGVSGTSTTGGIGVWGVSSSSSPNSVNADGVLGESSSPIGSGVAGINHSVNGTGTWGSATQGWGFATDSNVTQARSMGGWAKAMVYFVGGAVKRCYNSQIPSSTASTAPCGITITSLASNYWIVDFGFGIDDRFVMASFIAPAANSQLLYCLSSDGCAVTSTQVYLYAEGQCVTGDCLVDPVYIIVF